MKPLLLALRQKKTLQYSVRQTCKSSYLEFFPDLQLYQNHQMICPGAESLWELRSRSCVSRPRCCARTSLGRIIHHFLPLRALVQHMRSFACKTWTFPLVPFGLVDLCLPFPFLIGKFLQQHQQKNKGFPQSHSATTSKKKKPQEPGRMMSAREEETHQRKEKPLYEEMIGCFV